MSGTCSIPQPLTGTVVCTSTASGFATATTYITGVCGAGWGSYAWGSTAWGSGWCFPLAINCVSSVMGAVTAPTGPNLTGLVSCISVVTGSPLGYLTGSVACVTTVTGEPFVVVYLTGVVACVTTVYAFLQILPKPTAGQPYGGAVYQTFAKPYSKRRQSSGRAAPRRSR